MNQLFSAAAALTPDGRLAPYWLRLEDGRIREAGEGPPPGAPDLHLDSGVLAPGFVDVHAHGAGGASFTEGAEAGRRALSAHREHGTTTMLASLVSAPLEQVLDQAEALRPLVESGELAGVHMEGPWLSPEHRGAHDPALLATPTSDAVSTVLRHPAGPLIRYVTLAPECEGGLEAVARLRRAGVVVGIGHTGAGCARTREALAAGASAATHLFNGMKGLGHRDPGPALALLEDPESFLELICDGVHLHPEMVRYVWDSAVRHGGPGRIVLVSDSMAAAAAEEGEYTLGGLRVAVRAGEARLVTEDGSPGSIAGSTLTMDKAVCFSITEAGVAPEHALAAATLNPAAMAGLEDVGRLAPGAQADLVHLDETWQLRRVMRHGRWIDEADR